MSRRPLIVLLLPVLLLLGGIYSLSNLLRATQWVQHTNDVRASLGRLSSTMVAAETGVRGYVVGGAPEFLEPYRRAATQWRLQLDEVRALTADNPEQQLRLTRLEQVMDARFELLVETRAAYDAGRRGAELSPLMLRGKRAMEAVAVVIAEMDREEERLDIVRQAEAVGRWRMTMLLLIGGAFAVVLVTASVWVQRREAEARRAREEGVARAHELFRLVLKGVDMGITVQDPSGRLVFANEAAATILGQESVEALLATPPERMMSRFEVFHFDGTPFPPDQLPSRAALQGHSSPEIPVRFRVQGAREDRWSQVRAVPARDASGKVVYALNFFREVTEKSREENQRAFLLRAVDELNASRDYEKTLSTVAKLAVPVLADWCAVDLVDGERTRRVATAHIDPAKLALVEELERRYPSDPNAATGGPEIIRTGKSEFIAEIPRELLRAAAVDEEHWKLIDQLQLSSYVGVPLRARGKTLGALTFAMAESGRRHTQKDLDFAQALADRAALAIDNARLLRELERALASETQRRQEAEDASRFAETFIGMLGHDLRNPLNAIKMSAELLKRKAAGETGAFDRILSSAQRMSNMVAQLLDLTRSRLAGGIPIERKSIDLRAVITEVVDGELRVAYPGRVIHWQPGAEARGWWDADRLAQVVSNLVGNALEHGDPSRPVRVGLSQSEDAVALEVHSEGPPIAPQLLPVIFDPYRRDTARGERSKGLGLGLFITEQIVLAHGGQIEVRSSEEHGTTFTVMLPRSAPGTLAA